MAEGQPTLKPARAYAETVKAKASPVPMEVDDPSEHSDMEADNESDVPMEDDGSNASEDDSDTADTDTEILNAQQPAKSKQTLSQCLSHHTIRSY
jgi:hypothetical protein